MRTLLTPEQSKSGSCVQLRAPGDLYIQSFDAYGYQRELILLESGLGYKLTVYQHPGRRETRELSRAQGRKLMAALIARAESEQYHVLLFSPIAPRNAGFVHLQEAIFRGDDFLAILEQV